MIKQPPKRILISRTDSIGDVVLSLPMAGVLKSMFPDVEIFFLGKNYTRTVIESCVHIHKFISWDELETTDQDIATELLKELEIDVIIHAFPRPEIARLAKKAGIPHRIGATGRAYHLNTVNHPVLLSRKRSELHEAQLNLKLLKPLGWNKVLSRDEIPSYYGLKPLTEPPTEIKALLSLTKFNLIIHPKSKGSAREWGLDNFNRLVDILPREKFELFITGTKEEGELIENELFLTRDHVHNLCGKLDLKQLISFIAAADGLLAASTGPLHLAAALGIHALGLYPPIRPMHPGRWAALGAKAAFLVKNKKCSDCRNSLSCHCLHEIDAREVYQNLMELFSEDRPSTH